MPSAPASIVSAERVASSRKAVESFLKHQEEWIAKAADAAKKGFPIETLGICQNQIHAMLRRGLWLHAQVQSLREHPKAWRDEYLFDLLLESEHELMEGARDPELYSAAQRFDVIDDETTQKLSRLYKFSSYALREIFSYNQRQKRHPPVESLADEWLEVDRTCLANLRACFTEYDERIEKLIKELQ